MSLYAVERSTGLELYYQKRYAPEDAIEVPDYSDPPDPSYRLHLDTENKKLVWLAPSPVTPMPTDPVKVLQQENELLKSQIKAQSDRADFMEDCLAEMSAAVYKV